MSAKGFVEQIISVDRETTSPQRIVLKPTQSQRRPKNRQTNVDKECSKNTDGSEFDT